MRLPIAHLLLTAALFGSALGCSALDPIELPLPGEFLHRAEDDPTPAERAAQAAEQVVRGVQWDAAQVPGYQEVKQLLAAYHLEPVDHPLTAAECACTAAARSQMAAVLEKEASSVGRELHAHRRRGPSELLPGILRDRARAERNNAAQEALVAYYQLADVHLQHQVLGDSYQELRSLQQTIQALRGAGIPLDQDPSQIDRQLAELDRQSAELDVNEARLTAHVKTLLHIDPYATTGIETECEVKPRPAAYELPDAMQIARENDFQLRSIDQFLHYGQTEDLSLARGLLQVANPLLGQAPGPLGCWARLRAMCGCNESQEMELHVRKAQLRELRTMRQQQLDLEVANAIVTVQQRFLNVGIAKDVLGSWEQRVAVLESQRVSQKSAYGELVEAKLQRLQAKSDLLHKLLLLEIAHAELRGVMGLLVEECGLSHSGVSPGSAPPCTHVGPAPTSS